MRTEATEETRRMVHVATRISQEEYGELMRLVDDLNDQSLLYGTKPYTLSMVVRDAIRARISPTELISEKERANRLERLVKDVLATLSDCVSAETAVYHAKRRITSEIS
jgi:hypothetical protein